MTDTKFEEVGRVGDVTDASDIVVSKVIRDGKLDGFLISKYVKTDKYTGFAKGGIMIPDDRLAELVELLSK